MGFNDRLLICMGITNRLLVCLGINDRLLICMGITNRLLVCIGIIMRCNIMKVGGRDPPTLQIILDLSVPEKELAKTRSQI